MTHRESECPVCGATIRFDDRPAVGELKDCLDCGVELEVLDLNPITLAEAPQEEEDWGE